MPGPYDVRPMPSVDEALLARLQLCETATFGHWRLYGFCGPELRALLPRRRIAGVAVTLNVPDDDGTMLHYATDLVRPGHILCVDRGGDMQRACWGGGVTAAAKRNGAIGAMVDGLITDRREIEDMDFPMWSRGEGSRTTRLSGIGGRMNHPIRLGHAVVQPGDLILADENGVVVLPQEDGLEAEIDRVLATQERSVTNEAKLRSGEPLSKMTTVYERVTASMAESQPA